MRLLVALGMAVSPAAAAPASPATDETFVAALREVLMHDHTDLRDGEWILKACRQDVPGVVRELARIVGGPSAALRVEAASMLAELGPGAAAAVPALTQAVVRSADEDTRWAAARALEASGSRDVAALAALAEYRKTRKE